MAWKLLPTDYTDAVWSGLKRYTQVDNSDGTVSVSYTHLGMILAFTGVATPLGVGLILAGAAALGTAAVSYTHLDVYKRQVLYC